MDIPIENHSLADFWDMKTRERESILLQAIIDTHAWHYERNMAYRHTVSSRGIKSTVSLTDFPCLLRPTAQTFKSYIDLLGTPFPQDRPQAFLEWLDDQLSVELPRDRYNHFRGRYRSLEVFLKDIERIYSDFGFEISTSSGTSGRSTIMVRDQVGIDKTVESFYQASQRFLGMKADHRAIFIMPRLTRIAMVRMASFSVERVGLTESQINYTIPYPA